MLRLTEIKLPLDHPEAALRSAILQRLKLRDSELTGFTIHKRSHDARKKSAIQLVYIVDIETPREAELLRQLQNDPHVSRTPDMTYKPVAQAPENISERPVVIGTGPCGYFAALNLAQMGFRPIVLERGKAVRERSADTFSLWREHVLNPESNVQYGEGGAGTFSDGKLYSQVRDPKHLGRKVLQELVKAGAPAEILYVHRPHIGTFRLARVVQSLRVQIQALGGEIRFEHKVTDLDIAIDSQGIRRVRGVVLADGSTLAANHIVLAIGHSARDTFQMLYDRGVYIEAKPFSIGFRVEHPQKLIDQVRFGAAAGNKALGAADYKLVHHCANGRSVYSFCMCPGGQVVAAASEPGRVVTNGMSQYSRAERNANAALVVGITPDEDYPGHPLAGMELQRRLEERAYALGGSNYEAPGQLVGDFLAGKASTALGSVTPSYTPGVHLCNLADLLPPFATEALREALLAFDKQIKGYAMRDAVLTGVETRTSSPIRIKRDDVTGESINTHGLYPAGEGAGYAGGILSAAIDGLKIAEHVALAMLHEVQSQS